MLKAAVMIMERKKDKRSRKKKRNNVLIDHAWKVKKNGKKITVP